LPNNKKTDVAGKIAKVERLIEAVATYIESKLDGGSTSSAESAKQHVEEKASLQTEENELQGQLKELFEMLTKPMDSVGGCEHNYAPYYFSN
jgi:hypothetical protein